MEGKGGNVSNLHMVKALCFKICQGGVMLTPKLEVGLFI